MHLHPRTLRVLQLSGRLARRCTDRTSQSLAQRGIEPVDLLLIQARSQGKGGQPRGMKHLVGVGVADASQEPLILQQPLDLGSAVLQ